MLREESLRPGYHDLVRPEILARIPFSARKVLDLGCGTGALGKALKERQDCRVDGLELNPEAYEEARKNLYLVHRGSLDTFDPEKFAGPYDVIVCADILEHIINPWSALRKYSQLLSSDGLVVASLPNIAHRSVATEVVRGLFRYVPAGILDVAHLRFFTQITMYQLFVKAHLKIVSVQSHPAPENPIQYIITAVKLRTQFDSSKVTIVIPVLNALEYLQETIGSIREHTDYPYKVIVVDNGSKKDTQKWIEDQRDILHIRSEQNLGFPTGVNLGLECVNTPYALVMNSDILVTPGWLTDMVATAEGDPLIGIVGPVTNSVSGPQRDPEARYNSLEEMYVYALSKKKLPGPRLQVFPRIVFFCALVKSELFDKLGFLDEGFGMGNYEDDDFCMRARLAAFKSVIDRHVFVHHYGSRTFRAMGIDYAALMKKSKAYFERKWGMDSKNVPRR